MQEPSVSLLAQRLIQGDRQALSKSITLVESKLERHHYQAQELLALLSNSRQNLNQNTFRVGISGAPGVGKSSLFVLWLLLLQCLFSYWLQYRSIWNYVGKRF